MRTTTQESGVLMALVGKLSNAGFGYAPQRTCVGRGNSAGRRGERLDAEFVQGEGEC